MKRPNRKDYINKSTKIQLIADQELYIDSLEAELKQLRIGSVVRQSEQYCECGWLEKGEKKELNSYLVCKHCDKFL